MLIFLLVSFPFFCKPKPQATSQKATSTEELIPYQDAKFVLVTSRNGLNLRSTASIQGKKILTIPYGSMLPITEFGKQLEVIQERNGFWLKTEYNRNTGWIFSGFVIFGQTLDGLKDYKRSLEEPAKFPPPAEIRKLKADADRNSDFIRTKTSEQKLGRWTVAQYKYENKPEKYDCLATMTGVAFSHPAVAPIELQARKILGLNAKFANVIPVFSDLGGCSCMQLKFLSLYFPVESELHSIDLEMPLQREGNCGEAGGSNVETKYDKSTDTIIQQTKAPLCPSANSNNADAGAVGSGEAQFAGWAYTRYVVIQGLSTGQPRLTTVQSLPADLLKVWEASPNLAFTREY